RNPGEFWNVHSPCMQEWAQPHRILASDSQEAPPRYELRGGESGSNARRTARLTRRIRAADNGRGSRSPSSDFFNVVTKCPFSHDGPANPVSPGSNRRVVGPSAPWLPNGTIRMESTRSLRLRESSDITTTQWRAFPNIAVQ